MHGLREKEFLLLVAIKGEKTLKNYFDNNFNESDHEQYGKFFESIRKLLLTAYQEFSEPDKLDRLGKSIPASMMVKDPVKGESIPTPEKVAIETAYNALQLIHLINQRNDERDENI